MREYAFERLDVWQNARNFAFHIYTLTKTFPEDEKYGITSQIRRASVSICSNIAEGSSRRSNQEKIRYIEMSYGSTLEVLNLLIICYDLKYISLEKNLEMRAFIEEITNKLNKLKISVGKK